MRIVGEWNGPSLPTGERWVKTENGQRWHVFQDGQVKDAPYRVNGDHICPESEPQRRPKGSR